MSSGSMVCGCKVRQSSGCHCQICIACNGTCIGCVSRHDGVIRQAAWHISSKGCTWLNNVWLRCRSFSHVWLSCWHSGHTWLIYRWPSVLRGDSFWAWNCVHGALLAKARRQIRFYTHPYTHSLGWLVLPAKREQIDPYNCALQHARIAAHSNTLASHRAGSSPGHPA